MQRDGCDFDKCVLDGIHLKAHVIGLHRHWVVFVSCRYSYVDLAFHSGWAEGCSAAGNYPLDYPCRMDAGGISWSGSVHWKKSASVFGQSHAALSSLFKVSVIERRKKKKERTLSVTSRRLKESGEQRWIEDRNKNDTPEGNWMGSLAETSLGDAVIGQGAGQREEQREPGWHNDKHEESLTDYLKAQVCSHTHTRRWHSALTKILQRVQRTQDSDMWTCPWMERVPGELSPAFTWHQSQPSSAYNHYGFRISHRANSSRLPHSHSSLFNSNSPTSAKLWCVFWQNRRPDSSV